MLVRVKFISSTQQQTRHKIMANYTVIVEGGKVRFNIKAVTGYQAIYKACDFVLNYPKLAGALVSYSEGCPEYDKTLPFVTMTSSAGFKRRYKVNPNTNKNVIKYLLDSVSNACH